MKTYTESGKERGQGGFATSLTALFVRVAEFAHVSRRESARLFPRLCDAFFIESDTFFIAAPYRR